MAEQIRTGLEEQVLQVQASEVKNVLDEYWYNKPVREHVKEFAVLFSVIALGIGAVLAYQGGSLATTFALATLAGLLTYLGYKAPKVLHPVWESWMFLAEKLSIVMTWVILFLAWALMMVPMSCLLRVLRIKVMDVTYDAAVTTYWENRDEKTNDFKLLERQF